MSRKHLKFVAYFSACFLFLSSGLSAAAYGMTAGGASDNQRILVCTSQGLKWISLAEFGIEGDLGNDVKPVAEGHYCSFCLFAFHHIDNALENTALSASLNPGYTQLQLTYVADIDPLNFLLPSDTSPRAPPLSF